MEIGVLFQVIGAALVFIIFFAIGIGILSQFIYICEPNKLLVISGRKGKDVGYRVIFGGRAFRIPVIERVSFMDRSQIPVMVEVGNSFSKGGIPMTIHAIANVKITNDPKYVTNAIERFLGRSNEDIAKVVKETLEGILRGIVATLTPEQVNEDRMEFAHRIAQDVEKDLLKLGVHLDTFKIQSVFDEVGYMKEVSKKRISEIIRDAKNAESNAMREAEQIEASAHQRAELASNLSSKDIMQKENELRKIRADLDKLIQVEQETISARIEQTRAQMDQKLQEIRQQLQHFKLQVEQVLPAEFNREAKQLIAEGDASPIFENTKATAEVMDMFAKAWQEAGEHVENIYVYQHLEEIMSAIGSITQKLKIKSIDIVDGGSMDTVFNTIDINFRLVSELFTKITEITGIDITKALNPGKQN